MAVYQNDVELLNAINAALKEMPASTIQQLKDTYQIK